MILNILIVKETKFNESRVCLTPDHVHELIERGYTVFVEKSAGNSAGFSDKNYKDAGASIRELDINCKDSFNSFIEKIDIVIRVKRPTRYREAGTIRCFK